ncbi:MAG: hypothetical protein J5736_03210 [Bacilli bacterium]|nr:hypothetical protein [Bacilli bacterium]
MKTYVSKGSICVRDPYGLVYAVCELEYLFRKDDTFRYVFRPNYSVISLLTQDQFQGIPGLNLDLKREEYIRENQIPVFISERVPQRNREDLELLLKEVGLEYLEPILYLIRTKNQYFGDDFFVTPFHEKETVSFERPRAGETTNRYLKEILSKICLGDRVLVGKQIIDDENRKMAHDLFYAIYSSSTEAEKDHRQEGVARAKAQGKYRGRKPVSVDTPKFVELLDEVELGRLTVGEAATSLGISRDKYYRVRKKLLGHSLFSASLEDE